MIEDCAQAFLAQMTIATSAQSARSPASVCSKGKQMTTGEGGLVATSDEPSLAGCFCSLTRPGDTATLTPITISCTKLSHE